MFTNYKFYDSTADTSNAPGTGSLSALSISPLGGYRSIPSTLSNNDFVAIRIVDSTDASQWEVTQSIYTASTSSLSRGTLLTASSGLRINFANPVKVYIVAPSDHFNIINSLSANNIMLAGNNTSLTSVQDLNNIFHSAGIFTGGQILSASISSNTISVCAAQLALKYTSATGVTDTLYHCSFSGGNLNVPINTTVFVGLEGDSGTISLTAKSSDIWDYISEVPLGIVVNANGVLHILQDPHTVSNHASKMAQFNYETMPFSRDMRNGGLILSESADNNRRIIISSGAMWDRLNRYVVPEFNSTSSTIGAYYRDGAGGYTLTAQNTWDNLHYDDGTGILATLNTNKYAMHWYYEEPEGDVYSIYGRGQYNSLGDARTEPEPIGLPDDVSYHSRLIGRVIFIKSATIATEVQSAFATVFANAATTNLPMAGDVTGNTNSAIVTGLQGKAILTDALLANDIYYYNGTSIAHDAQGGDVSGSITSTRVNALKGVPLNTSLTSGTNQVSIYNGTDIKFVDPYQIYLMTQIFS